MENFMNIARKRENLTLIALAVCVAAAFFVTWNSYKRYSSLIPFDSETFCQGAACENSDHCVDVVKNNKNSVYVAGWAFIRGHENVMFKNKFVIYNVPTGKYYYANIKCMKRPDVSRAFAIDGKIPNYDNSGFLATLKKDTIKLAGLNKFYIAYDDGVSKCLIDLNLTLDIQ